MQDNLATIAKAFRHNSGKHFLDSGDYYGRHYDKPPITEQTPLVSIETWGNSEVNATIDTARFLDETCEVDSEIQSNFDAWAALEENSELSWFEAGETFATKILGLKQLARDNTYNGENDLSQTYVWEVYAGEDDGDWIYNDDALMVVYAHTGCDVRGGYAYPLFLRHQGDYSIPVDLVAEFGIVEGRRDGEELSREECQELDEEWQCGYSSNPSYHMSKQIERIFGFTKTVDTVVVKLKSGEIVKIAAGARTY
jgi:hypothetical protein